MWTMSTILQNFLNILFPEACIHCGDEQSSPLLLCRNCIAELPKTLHPIHTPELIHQLWGMAEYNGPFGALMRRCKYKPDLQILQELIYRMECSALPWQEIQVITHVPTTPARIFHRGFDQAQILAQMLSKSISIPYLPLLKRIDRHPQSLRTYVQRGQGLSYRFQHKSIHTPKTILIVDDICTTGNTLDAAAIPLLNEGIEKIYGLVIGY